MSAGRGETPDVPPPQVILSRRLNLLLDAAEEKRGTAVTFREVREDLADRGISMSRARWFYMKDGTRAFVTDKKMLTAICDIFGVDPSYLLDMDSETIPESIQARLEFVRALRHARVQALAARTLADVSPETLKVITEFLKRDMAAGVDVATRTASSGNEDERREEP